MGRLAGPCDPTQREVSEHSLTFCGDVCRKLKVCGTIDRLLAALHKLLGAAHHVITMRKET